MLGVIIIQTCLLLIVAVFGFHTPVQGFLLEVFLLQLLLGSVGMSFGLVISSVSRQETEAVQIALASFFPCNFQIC